MYATRAANKTETEQMRRSYPSPLGHLVTGYSTREDGQLECAIDCMSETTAVNLPEVVAVRRKMPNGCFIYRVILSR